MSLELYDLCDTFLSQVMSLLCGKSLLYGSIKLSLTKLNVNTRVNSTFLGHIPVILTREQFAKSVLSVRCKTMSNISSRHGQISNFFPTTLLERRMRGDLIETFKIINGFVNYGHNMFRYKVYQTRNLQ